MAPAIRTHYATSHIFAKSVLECFAYTVAKKKMQLKKVCTPLQGQGQGYLSLDLTGTGTGTVVVLVVSTVYTSSLD